jgi:predicted lipoprotein with Yx(FWY)xxD motif
MARTGLTGSSQLARRSRRVGRGRLVADGLAAAGVLTGVTVGMANVAGASSTSNGKAKTIKVSTTTIPKVGTVLTTASGLTLYRFTQDLTGKSACTGVCAKIWPPLTAAKGEHVQGPNGVKGLAVINVGHGRWQVAFHNVALYRFAGDKKKGQVKGQGVENAWFAVMKSGIPAGNAAPAATPPTPAPTPSTTPVTTPPTTAATTPPTPPATHVTAPPVTAPPATTTTAPPMSGGAGF